MEKTFDGGKAWDSKGREGLWSDLGKDFVYWSSKEVSTLEGLLRVTTLARCWILELQVSPNHWLMRRWARNANTMHSVWTLPEYQSSDSFPWLHFAQVEWDIMFSQLCSWMKVMLMAAFNACLTLPLSWCIIMVNDQVSVPKYLGTPSISYCNVANPGTSEGWRRRHPSTVEHHQRFASSELLLLILSCGCIGKWNISTIDNSFTSIVQSRAPHQRDAEKSSHIL